MCDRNKMKKSETQSIKAPVLLSAGFSGSESLSWCSFWPLCILLQISKWPSADRRVSFCTVYAFHSSQSWPKKSTAKKCSWKQSPASRAAGSWRAKQVPKSAFLSCCIQWQHVLDCLMPALTRGAGERGFWPFKAGRDLGPALSPLDRWFSAKFLCGWWSFLYSASCWHLEVGEGNFTVKMCCSLYPFLPFYW